MSSLHYSSRLPIYVIRNGATCVRRLLCNHNRMLHNKNNTSLKIDFLEQRIRSLHIYSNAVRGTVSTRNFCVGVPLNIHLSIYR